MKIATAKFQPIRKLSVFNYSAAYTVPASIWFHGEKLF